MPVELKILISSTIEEIIGDTIHINLHRFDTQGTEVEDTIASMITDSIQVVIKTFLKRNLQMKQSNKPSETD